MCYCVSTDCGSDLPTGKVKSFAAFEVLTRIFNMAFSRSTTHFIAITRIETLHFIVLSFDCHELTNPKTECIIKVNKPFTPSNRLLCF